MNSAPQSLQNLRCQGLGAVIARVITRWLAAVHCGTMHRPRPPAQGRRCNCSPISCWNVDPIENVLEPEALGARNKLAMACASSPSLRPLSSTKFVFDAWNRFAATPQRDRSTPCSASARASDPPTTATSSDNAADPGRPLVCQPPPALRSTSIRAESLGPPACLTALETKLPHESKSIRPAHRPAIGPQNRAGNVEGRSTSGVTGSKGRSPL